VLGGLGLLSSLRGVGGAGVGKLLILEGSTPSWDIGKALGVEESVLNCFCRRARKSLSWIWERPEGERVKSHKDVVV
jgi:hypothetical protein